MFDKTILISAYRCDPAEVSEANIAFTWLNILSKRFKIVLLTTTKAEQSIKMFYGKNFPKHLRIVSFPDKYPFKNKRIIRESVKLGYFFFNYKVKAYLKRNKEIIDGCDLIFQKSPESFRYFTSLVYFPKPVYIGPLSGGLKPPAQMKNFFRKESILYKFRNLDSLILKLPVYKRQFSKAEKILISFDYLDNILPKQYLRRKKILLNTGVDCSEYPQAVNKSKTVSIIYVGRLTRYKGAELLIKALNEIKQLDFRLDILGDGEEKDYLGKLVESFGLKDKVQFHGFKSQHEVKQLYKSASVFCLPTLTESIGIVFLEAMASGLPIVTINNGGPKYICPEEGAIKIPISSEIEIINGIKNGIEFLIWNPEERLRMGEFNRKYCRENYDWKVLEQSILTFFTEELSYHSEV